MKNLNYPYEDFLRLSKGKSFTTEKNCLSQWNSTRIKEGVTEAYFYSRLKQTKPDVFENMKTSSKSKYNIPIKTKFIDESKIINVSQKYLIALDNVNLDDEDDVFTSNIIQFFNSKNKSLSIKSPYDTGKTKLLSKIFTKYDPKRILWLSYRKTLTNDILGSFKDEFNFKDYQHGEYRADRLIIQLDSLLKLKPCMMFADDEYEIPKYDIIIID
jgi:superfamily II DNA or RNA helicase